MKVLVVDDRKSVLENMIHHTKSIESIDECDTTLSAPDAIEMLKEKQYDVAFLDIEMPIMNGITLAKKLKDIYPKINIVFITGHKEYAIDSYRVGASDFLVKPISKKAILASLDNLRNPIEPVALKKKPLEARCFGKFSLFADGTPIAYRYSKTEELVAYLIYMNGTPVTMGELLGIIWEDAPVSNNMKAYLRKLISELKSILKTHDAEKALIKTRNEISVSPEFFDCDYFEFLKGNPKFVNKYQGEFMIQYSWAEYWGGGMGDDY
ncbi:MAG: response regulator [Lachnospiraceae bacterium]|nr:response regulator [Lachnospiraceae bacterium]